MANVSVGTIEAMLVLRDQMGPALNSVAKAANSAAPAMAKAESAAKGLDSSIGNSAQRIGKFADSLGRTSTTLARSADAFGLPTQALRTLDDVADVAELGLTKLGTGAASTALSFKTLQLSMLGPVAAAAAIGAALGTLLNKFESVRNAADALFPSMARFLGLMDEVDSRPLANVSQSAFQADIAAKNAEAQKKQVESLRALGVASKDIAELYKGTMTPELQKQLGLTKENVKAEDDRAAAAKRSADQFADLTDSLSGRKAQAEADTLLRAFTKEGGAQGIANLDAFRKRLEDLQAQGAKISDRGLLAVLSGGKVDDLSKIDLGGLDLGEDTANAMERVSKSGVEAAAAWREMAAAGRAAGLSSEEVATAMERAGASSDQVKLAFEQIAKSKGLGDSLKAGLKAGLKDLPNVILGAIQGGGDVFKAVGASLGGRFGESMAEPLTKILSQKLGDTLGGALGSLLPGLGSLLGSGLGSLVSKGIGALGSALGIGGNKAIMQLNDTRDAFLASHGGFVELQKKLQGLSNQDLVKKIFDAKTVDQFNAAVSEVNRLLGNQEEAQAALQDAVERYGFTVEELGPKFRQQELDSQAGQLLQDFKLLTASGIETGVVLTKMSENLSDYVQTAIRAGVSVPEAMRPMIEAAIQNGTLLDENGQAYASAEAAGITFAQTMSEQFSTLIDKIGDLVAALTGIPNVSRTVNVDTVYADSGAPRGGAGGAGAGDYGGDYGGGVPEDYRAASGFNAMVTKPTRILVGEAGPEQVTVTPKGKMGEGGVGAGAVSSSLSIAATFNIDPLQSNAARDDLAKHSIDTFIRQARNSPMVRQLLRQNGGR